MDEHYADGVERWHAVVRKLRGRVQQLPGGYVEDIYQQHTGRLMIGPFWAWDTPTPVLQAILEDVDASLRGDW